MNEKPRTEIDAEERARIFHEEYGNDIDAGSTLADIVIAAGNYLSRIIGKDDVDAGMARMIESVVKGSGQKMAQPSDWREALDDSRQDCYSELDLGTRLHDLAAYAVYGIVLDSDDDVLQISKNLESNIKYVEDFFLDTPSNQWKLDPNNDLARLVLLARNRWELDNGRPIEPAALAAFGGVSEGRIRNMMSGAKRTFSPVGGNIGAQEALAWLADRGEFWNSIWREQRLPGYGSKRLLPLQRAVFVPVARDGSAFHPGLQRGGKYPIGEKGSEIQIENFESALSELQRMPVPYWRRPNINGHWGIVSGIRWARLDASDLEILAENPNHKIPDDGRA